MCLARSFPIQPHCWRKVPLPTVSSKWAFIIMFILCKCDNMRYLGCSRWCWINKCEKMQYSWMTAMLLFFHVSLTEMCYCVKKPEGILTCRVFLFYSEHKSILHIRCPLSKIMDAKEARVPPDYGHLQRALSHFAKEKVKKKKRRPLIYIFVCLKLKVFHKPQLGLPGNTWGPD